MKIVADENIPLLTRFFDGLGEVVQLAGREITAEHVVDADFLIVRSVTKVNRELLEGSSVKFVGTCTIGTDHLDKAYLDSRGIRYCNAPGSNANSVVEYVLSCLSILTETNGLVWDDMTVGIIGYGNVGSLLAARLKCLGIAYKAYDPFLEDPSLCSFDEVMKCDVISLHVPLSHDGPYPTHHMIDARVLAGLKSEQVLINSSRGPVISNAELNQHLISDPQLTVILDVWETEPDISVELAGRVLIGTPHIAGYSYDGKVKGTEMIYRALCQFLGLPSRHSLGQFLEEPPLSKMAFTSNANVDWCIHTAIRACFDVRHDHSVLQASLRLPIEQRMAAFDRLRKNYRCRREFSGVKIQLKQVGPELLSKFKSLGFNVKI
jgi:erythronate-4-phosphate dehydrogenase